MHQIDQVVWAKCGHFFIKLIVTSKITDSHPYTTDTSDAETRRHRTPKPTDTMIAIDTTICQTLNTTVECFEITQHLIAADYMYLALSTNKRSNYGQDTKQSCVLIQV